MPWEEFEIGVFNASAGGFGGCPFVGSATGNAPTEDLAYALRASGAEVAVNVAAVADAARIVAPAVGREPGSRLAAIAER